MDTGTDERVYSFLWLNGQISLQFIVRIPTALPVASYVYRSSEPLQCTNITEERSNSSLPTCTRGACRGRWHSISESWTERLFNDR